MKLFSKILLLAGCVAVLGLGAGSLLAQDKSDDAPATPPRGDKGDSQNGDNPRSRRNFDPAQMQQRFMEMVRTDLDFTNDTEWAAVQPMVQKVLDARRDVGFGGMNRMFGRNRGGGGGNNGGNRGGMFGAPSPEAEALQKALDDNAPAGQVKDMLARYRSSQKAKQDKLEAAQDDLKKVLTVKQEAHASLLGLVK